MSEARQRVIETNRSLRLIKNELESLLEKGVISDSTFDSINALLPAESPLSGPGTSSSSSRSNNPTPAPATESPAATTTTTTTAPPPSYAQSTASPPALPSRNKSSSTQPPEKPVLVYARALYRYTAGDARDCSFERDDRLAVHEYMNADWWLGKNLRTGQEGIFPRNYVMVEEAHQKMTAPTPVPAPAPVPYQQPQYAASAPGGGGGGYPVSPVPVHGYSSAPPPPQQQPQQHQGEESTSSKIGEHGKKFGKKLGNAAIFGAGATIGSNIVNSIF